jgi:hypothetical protein
MTLPAETNPDQEKRAPTVNTMTLYDKNGTTIRSIVEADSLRAMLDPDRYGPGPGRDTAAG